MPPTVRLLSLTTSAGLLKGVTIEPAPGVTCVIGEPSSGKSTVVETIRFLANHDSTWINMLLGHVEPDYGPNHPEFGHLRATLAGGTATCRLLVDYGNRTEILRVERNAADHLPRVYKDGTDKPGDRSVLECFEIYSQGDIQRIADDVRRRLALLDRPERQTIESLWNQLALHAAEANEIDVEYAVSGDLLEKQEIALDPLKERREKLAFLRQRRPDAPPEVEAERVQFDARRLLLETLERLEDERTTNLPAFNEIIRGQACYREAIESLSGVEVPEAREIARALISYHDLLVVLGGATQLAKEANVRALIEKLRVRFEELNRPYHRLKEEQQQFAQALREEDLVRGEVQRLERVEAEKKRTEGARSFERSATRSAPKSDT
jgi:energy-coupling factor transporter ATP-binding protein EcfA2